MKSDQILEAVRETEESRVMLKVFSLSSYGGDCGGADSGGRRGGLGRIVEQTVGCINLGFKGDIWDEIQN